MDISALFAQNIDRASPEPFYLQLSNAIEQAIEAGMFVPGDRLPTESELCRQFDLARSTVRETLRTLEDRQRIRVVPRRGAFVVDPEQAGWGLQVASGFFEGEVDANQRNVNTRVLQAEVQPLSGHCAKSLELADGSDGIVLRRIRCLDGKEAVYSKNYMPLTVHDAVFKGEVMQGGSLNKSLEAAGFRLVRARRSVEAIGAPADVAKLLDVPPGAPVLLVTSVSWGQDGRPYDYYNSYVRTDVVNVTVEAAAGPK